MVNSVGNVQLIQRINRIKVLDYIRKHGPTARTQVAKYTNLSLSSITNIINYLLSRDLVRQCGAITSSSAGRRASLIEFNASAMQTIAVNIEPSVAEIALCDLCGKAEISQRVELTRTHDAMHVLGVLEGEIRKILDKAKNPFAIGVAVNGHVSDDSGVVTSSIMRWKSVDVKRYFEEKFSLHVYVTNNSKTKAQWQVNELGEDAAKNMIFLDLTMGVGIISFFDGKINESVAGELGHTTVMKDGPQCFCGNRGCLELVCSVDYILSRCRQAHIRGCDSFDAAMNEFDAGDEQVRDIFRECAEYLGIGIANIISIFEPELIIINDDCLTACDFIYRTALSEAERRAYTVSSKPIEYRRVEITSAQALTGVAQYVTDRMFAMSGPVF